MRPRPLSMTTFIDIADEQLEARVDFRFTPGTPPSGPSWSSDGEPGDNPEVEITAIVASDGLMIDFDSLDRNQRARIEEEAMREGASV